MTQTHNEMERVFMCKHAQITLISAILALLLCSVQFKSFSTRAHWSTLRRQVRLCHNAAWKRQRHKPLNSPQLLTTLRSKTPSLASCNKVTNLVVSSPKLFSCRLGVWSAIVSRYKCIVGTGSWHVIMQHQRALADTDKPSGGHSLKYSYHINTLINDKKSGNFRNIFVKLELDSVDTQSLLMLD